MFANLYEDRDELGPEQFRDAARAVGFRFLDRLVASYASTKVSSSQAREAFIRKLVDSIDAE